MKIVVSVSNDIVTDQRVHRVCNTLSNNGYQILLVGRKRRNSPDLGNYSFSTKRFRLIFEKGPCFYACLNVRLFLFLLFAKADIFLSNDLDTLAANYLASRIRRKKLVYDSHELFTEVPELVGRPRVKAFWERIEKRILPNISHSYTVCQSIANYYNKKYGISMQVVRNVPVQKSIEIPFYEREKILIYQGVLNKGRGLEMLIEAVSSLKDYRLLIVGSGDVEDKLKKLTNDLKANNIRFLGRIAPDELHPITCSAILGFSLEEDLGLNYRYALPNKIFDYIQAGVPILISALPEMQAVAEEFGVGNVFSGNSAATLADEIQKTTTNKAHLQELHENCVKAASLLHWENEKHKLIDVFSSLTI